MAALAEVLPAAPTLAELARVANREHAQAFSAASAMIEHAIRAGEALLAAKAQTPPGAWTRWLKDEFVASPETANVYMRLAHHQDEIRARTEIKSIAQARRVLRELGAVREEHGSQGRGVYVSEAVREEARAMRREGMQLREIAETLGYQLSTVHGWVNPDSIQRRRTRQAKSKARRREARRALERQERDRLARKTGGSVAECYSLVRRTAQELDRTIGEQEDVELRAALNVALTKVHAAEDAVVRALGIAMGPTAQGTREPEEGTDA